VRVRLVRGVATQTHRAVLRAGHEQQLVRVEVHGSNGALVLLELVYLPHPTPSSVRQRNPVVEALHDGCQRAPVDDAVFAA
jgi:hypothetical protein